MSKDMELDEIPLSPELVFLQASNCRYFHAPRDSAKITPSNRYPPLYLYSLNAWMREFEIAQKSS